MTLTSVTRSARATAGPETLPEPNPPRGPGWGAVAGVSLFYGVVVIVATFPYVLKMATELPAPGDPPQHLWILRWYRACLAEGRSPLVCPELQYPVGAPLSGFSPLHLQAALFLPLSLAAGNDVLSYNLLWAFGLVTTGLGTFALAWSVVRDRASACLAGLSAMLSGPVMLHSQGHLELVSLGAFPVFLLGWLRFVDRPSRGRLVAASALYVLLAACAAYYMVLATVPAVLYVAWHAHGAGWKGLGPWAKARAGWLVGFVALVVPTLALLFAANLWAAAAGYTVKRGYSEFRVTGAPLWGYVLPTKFHLLGRLLPLDFYSGPAYAGAFRYLVVENGSYLGLVTVGLLVYALGLSRRGGLSGYWWAALAVLVVLSAGAAVTVGGREVTLPAGWLWKLVPPFRLTRSVARFNLLAAVVAAVVAAAGLKHLLARLPGRGARRAACTGLAAVMVADLGFVPYRSHAIPPAPACYEAVRRLDPGATLLELPPQASAMDITLLDRTYWQSEHRLKTSAGYSGMRNERYDAEIFAGTPFPLWTRGFLDDPRDGRYGAVAGAAFRDYLWLFLTVHGYSHVVAHRVPAPAFGGMATLGRIDAELRGSKVFEDARATVYARDRLAPPGRPVAVVTAGWEPLIDWPQTLLYGVKPEARLSVYNPDPARALRIELEAAGVRQPRTVRLRHRAGGAELARWRVAPDAPATYTSPPLRLPAGLHELTLESDGRRPPAAMYLAVDETRGPISLYVIALRVRADGGAGGP